jgi:hypothetical protein
VDAAQAKAKTARATEEDAGGGPFVTALQARLQAELALHDGDIKAKYDGYAGNLFINANSNESSPPTVVDQARNPLTKASGKPYPGCYVNASIEFWPQKDHPKGGSRINAQLRGIQFYKDGDSFSAGRPADADEFDDVAEGADAEDFA